MWGGGEHQEHASYIVWRDGGELLFSNYYILHSINIAINLHTTQHNTTQHILNFSYRFLQLPENSRSHNQD
jgi:hypothetical protein